MKIVQIQCIYKCSSICVQFPKFFFFESHGIDPGY